MLFVLEFELFCLLKSKISGSGIELLFLLKFILPLFDLLSLIDREEKISSGLILLLVLVVTLLVLLLSEEVKLKISIFSLLLFLILLDLLIVSVFFGLKSKISLGSFSATSSNISALSFLCGFLISKSKFDFLLITSSFFLSTFSLVFLLL